MADEYAARSTVERDADAESLAMQRDELITLVRCGALRPLRPRCWSVLVAIVAASPERVSARRIQALTGMSRRNVMRALSELQTAELVARKRRRRH